MSQQHWDRRDSKRATRTRGMRVVGRSVFTITQAIAKRDALKGATK